MSAADTVQELNRELARQISDEARVNPESPYLDKFVGIANGRVVVVADNWDDLAQRLHQAEPDTTRSFCFEVGVDYQTIQQIWGTS